MYDKKYILEKIEEFNKHNYINDDMECGVCYLAYFNVGERGWFLQEVEDCFGYTSVHRIHTSIVKSVEYFGFPISNQIIVETNNTKFTFKLIKD